MSTLKKELTDIADNVRYVTVTDEKIPFSKFKNIPKDVLKKGYLYSAQNLSDLLEVLPEGEMFELEHLKKTHKVLPVAWELFQSQDGERTDYRGMYNPSGTENISYPGSFGGWQYSEYILPKYPLKPTFAYGMFFKCTSLLSAPEVDLSQCTNISAMYNGCTNLKYVDKVETEVATGSTYLFTDCQELLKVGFINTPNATSYKASFNRCENLTYIRFAEKSIKGNISFLFSPKLTAESIKSILLGLDTSYTFTVNLHTDLKNTYNKKYGENAFEQWVVENKGNCTIWY